MARPLPPCGGELEKGGNNKRCRCGYPLLPDPPPQGGRESSYVRRNDAEWIFALVQTVPVYASIQPLPAVEKRARLAVEKLDIGRTGAAGRGVTGDGGPRVE
jgi:hypothetical protein